jgi:hypothetical protein
VGVDMLAVTEFEELDSRDRVGGDEEDGHVMTLSWRDSGLDGLAATFVATGATVCWTLDVSGAGPTKAGALALDGPAITLSWRDSGLEGPAATFVVTGATGCRGLDVFGLVPLGAGTLVLDGPGAPTRQLDGPGAPARQFLLVRAACRERPDPLACDVAGYR